MAYGHLPAAIRVLSPAIVGAVMQLTAVVFLTAVFYLLAHARYFASGWPLSICAENISCESAAPLVRVAQMLRSTESAEELLARCTVARLAGDDFPTIWNDILNRHPLVSSLPIQVTIGTNPALQIRLWVGRSLRFEGGSFYLDQSPDVRRAVRFAALANPAYIGIEFAVSPSRGAAAILKKNAKQSVTGSVKQRAIMVLVIRR